jgi:DNA-binding PadR family transcriptional regulator
LPDPTVGGTVYYVGRSVGLGGLSEPALLVLAALAPGSKHGYAILRDVEVHAGQHLGPGTLYGVIARLEAQGFIEPLALEERGRRPYRITGAGRRALAEGLDELTRYQSALMELAGG